MKKVIKISMLLCLVLVMTIYSCKPDNDLMIGDPQNRITQLAGTWKLESVKQIDLFAQNNNFVDPARTDINLIEQDITNVAPFRDITMTFGKNGTLPSTFTIDYGAAPKIFKLTSGSWKVDDLNAPGTIKLINGTDTIPAKLGNVANLSSGMMTLQVIKSQGLKPRIQYNYNFSKN